VLCFDKQTLRGGRALHVEGSLSHAAGVPKGEMNSLPSPPCFAAPLRDEEGALLLVAREFGQELREETLDVGKSCRTGKARQQVSQRPGENQVGEGAPTRKGGELLGALCLPVYFTQGKWARTKIACLPGFPNGRQRFEQSYPLYIGAGGA
jgi:hypothetical protein